jgi:hypothetical protein
MEMNLKYPKRLQRGYNPRRAYKAGVNANDAQQNEAVNAGLPYVSANLQNTQHTRYLQSKNKKPNMTRNIAINA